MILVGQSPHVVFYFYADRFHNDKAWTQRNLSPKNLIDGGRLFESALFDDALTFLFHEEHERVERLLNVLAPSFGRLQTTQVVMTRRPGRRWRHRCRWSTAAAPRTAVKRRPPAFSAEVHHHHIRRQQQLQQSYVKEFKQATKYALRAWKRSSAVAEKPRDGPSHLKTFWSVFYMTVDNDSLWNCPNCRLCRRQCRSSAVNEVNKSTDAIGYCYYLLWAPSIRRVNVKPGLICEDWWIKTNILIGWCWTMVPRTTIKASRCLSMGLVQPKSDCVRRVQLP